MRTYCLLLCFVLMLLSAGASAQFSKARPVKVIDPNERLGYYDLDKTSSDELSAIRSNFTRDQMDLLNKGLNRDKQPSLFNYDGVVKNLSKMSGYKAYAIAQWQKGTASLVMIWIPKEENAHMPEGLRPVEDAGILMVMRSNSPGFAFLDKKDEPAARPVVTAVVAAGPARMAGTFAIGYGSKNGRIKVYYLYEVYTRSMVDGSVLLAKLKKETGDLQYVVHKFYARQSYAPVIKQFKEDQGRDAKKADWRYGGTVDDDGSSSWQVLTPQNPNSKMTYSTADMSQYVTSEPSSTSSYQQSEPANTNKRRHKCSYCQGKGYITITKTTYSNVGGTGTVGSTGYVDWQKAPTSIKHENKETKKCEFCKGTGEVD